jgi:RNA polymerase sigma-70 factor (ECF subfamily)
MARTYQTWPRIDQSHRNWVFTVACRIACRQARRAREEPFRAVASGWAISTHDDVDVVETIEEHNRLLRLLQLLPRQQRRATERYLDGLDAREISQQLNMRSVTVRSNLRHGRRKLQRLVSMDEQDLRSQAEQQLWDAFQNGDPLPAALRTVILKGWEMVKDLRVPPEHGKNVEPLDWDEVQRRRHESLLISCAWALDALAELGRTTKQMMVVADQDGVVL